MTKHAEDGAAERGGGGGEALEKLPADRFESAKAFADALGNARPRATTRRPAHGVREERGVSGACVRRRLAARRRPGRDRSLGLARCTARAHWPRGAVRHDTPARDEAHRGSGQRPIVLSPDGRSWSTRRSPAASQLLFLRTVDDPTPHESRERRAATCRSSRPTASGSGSSRRDW